MEHSKKRLPVLTIIFGATSILLCIALIFSLISLNKYKALADGDSVETIAPTDQPDEVIEPSIPVSEFKAYAAQYSPSMEFLQRFFEDEIVYKNSSGIVYAPINDTLKKNNFDFDNLVLNNGFYEYHENGVNIAKKGIDVSKYQGDIDWKRVAADGVEFAMLRIGRRGYVEGTIAIDETFVKNIKGATAAGVEVGVYFFSQAITTEEAIEEANFVIDNLKGYEISYPVVFDSEEIHEGDARTDDVTADEMTAIAKTFCDTVTDAGFHPMIYSNIGWFMDKVNIEELESYDKWFAQYFSRPFFPYDFQMWQYTAKGKVDGIEGNVDINLCFKDYAGTASEPTE